MRWLLALVPLFFAFWGRWVPAPQAGEHPLGPVPELAGVTDLAGHGAHLTEAGEAAILLYFHAGSSRYSLAGLEELVERLRVEEGSRSKALLWVLSATPEEAREVEPRLAPLGASARALVDAARSTFAAHGVVAAPTLLCVSARRHAVARVQGYGALFAFRAELGARLAAGLIERAEYEAALAGVVEAPAPDAAETRARILAGRLVAAGQLDEADALLVRARDEHPRSAWPLALQARCALARDQRERARTLAVELARTWPDAPETRYLEGLLAEANGEPERARATFRAALERCLFE